LVELYGADVALVKSGADVFEITSEGNVFVLKKATGRYPDDTDLKHLGAGLPA